MHSMLLSFITMFMQHNFLKKKVSIKVLLAEPESPNWDRREEDWKIR